MHMIQDMQSDRINPASYYAFTDADYMRHVIEMASATHRSVVRGVSSVPKGVVHGVVRVQGGQCARASAMSRHGSR
eukprot:10124134-Alexandrium_andersonii.AAC.1